MPSLRIDNLHLASTALGAAACPRCGYDQRGAIETWREACPLRGTCTECGLEFAWRELLRPDLKPPLWNVERPRSMLAFPGQVLATTVRAWMPWRMWRELRMTHEPRPARLVMFLVLFIIGFAFVICVSNGISVWAEWDEQLRRSNRLAVAAGAPMPMTSNEPGWWVLFQGTFMPLSDQSAGTFGGPMVARTGLILTLAPPRWHLLNMLADLGPPSVIVLAIPVCAALAFLALPISRRIAKVRWVHIIRATVYSFGITLPLCILTVVDYGLMKTNLTGQNAFATLVVLGWIAFLPTLFSYWSFAAGRYLGMSHPWAVGASVVVIGALVSLPVAGVIWSLFG